MLLELEKLSGELDLLLQEILGVHLVGGGVAAVLLNVETDGGAGGAGAGQANNDAAAGREAGIQTLVGGDGAVEVGIREVASVGDVAF